MVEYMVEFLGVCLNGWPSFNSNNLGQELSSVYINEYLLFIKQGSSQLSGDDADNETLNVNSSHWS